MDIQQLRSETAAVRFSCSKFGTRKALRHDQRSKAAAGFSADAAFLSASKKLLDTTCEEYRGVTAAMHDAENFWRSQTTPYPERGIRLIKKSRIVEFDLAMSGRSTAIKAAAKVLDASYASLIEQSRHSLGDLFNESDYPKSLDGAFSIAWDYPSVEPPEYLKSLNPDLYAAEVVKLQSRFQEAAELASESFAAEFGKLVANLADKLQPAADGTRKVLHASAIEKFEEFFSRFESLKLTSDSGLEKLIADAKSVLAGVSADEVRSNALLKGSLGESFAAINESVSKLISTRSRVFDLDQE